MAGSVVNAMWQHLLTDLLDTVVVYSSDKLVLYKYVVKASCTVRIRAGVIIVYDD